MPQGNQMAKLFPEFDHLHFRYLKQNRRATGNPSADDWNQFLDKTGISWTVLYPTAGLAVGRIIAPEWAVVACKAYNNWLYEKSPKEFAAQRRRAHPFPRCWRGHSRTAPSS